MLQLTRYEISSLQTGVYIPNCTLNTQLVDNRQPSQSTIGVRDSSNLGGAENFCPNLKKLPEFRCNSSEYLQTTTFARSARKLLHIFRAFHQNFRKSVENSGNLFTFTLSLPEFHLICARIFVLSCQNFRPQKFLESSPLPPSFVQYADDLKTVIPQTSLHI